jgi:hypothetical protein
MMRFTTLLGGAAFHDVVVSAIREEASLKVCTSMCAHSLANHSFRAD